MIQRNRVLKSKIGSYISKKKKKPIVEEAVEVWVINTPVLLFSAISLILLGLGLMSIFKLQVLQTKKFKIERMLFRMIQSGKIEKVIA